MSTMTAVQFDYLRDLVRKESAIVLEPGKEYLVESRLAPIARREGMESVGELVQRLVTSPAHPLRNVVVDGGVGLYFSFEHDPITMLERLIALEAGESHGLEGLTLARVRGTLQIEDPRLGELADRNLAQRVMFHTIIHKASPCVLIPCVS